MTALGPYWCYSLISLEIRVEISPKQVLRSLSPIKLVLEIGLSVCQSVVKISEELMIDQI